MPSGKIKSLILRGLRRSFQFFRAESVGLNRALEMIDLCGLARRHDGVWHTDKVHLLLFLVSRGIVR